MANDKDIKIGLQTVGADAAASEIEKVEEGFGKIPDKVKPAVDAIEEVPEAIDKIPDSTPDAVSAVDEVTQSIFRMEDAAKTAERQLDALEAKQRKAAREEKGILGTDVSGAAASGVGGLAEKAGFGREFHAASKVLGADALAAAGSIAAIGAAAVQSYRMLDGTINRFDRLKALAKETGQELGPELSLQLEALRETMGPVKTVVDAVGGALSEVWKTVKDPIGELTGANAVEEAMRNAAEQAERLNEARLAAANENQAGVAAAYQRELATLNEQEATMRRMAALRNQLNSIEVQRANNQIEIARQTGGDVELAQANALAVQLQAGLSQLGDNLRASQQNAEQARTEFDAASIAYQQAMKDNLHKLDPEQFQALSDAYDTTQRAYADANQAVADQQQIFESQKTLLLENVETELRALDQDSKGVVGDAADRLRTSIYNTIKEEFSSLGSASGEVSQALKSERTAAVQTIQSLAPTPQDTAAVKQAGTESKTAIQEMGNAFISTQASQAAVSKALTDRVNAMQRQLNQILSRLR